ncbi:LysE family translocator [Albimonas sp. CAU 1670]|uniref:LysE family translocator n=1 Tax=Albimonas sp. CAU 1670 TaxID=3032599 RepID=UPI0023DB0500|nr:LysE family translocator [Albimonas sp. CAU 1670]MDF2235856.1 LysE family translocator [Albimonas sp. CAU 1670]
MDLGLWLAFAAASAVLVAIPGPTVLLVVGFALGEGRRSVPAAAAGVTLGDLIATSVSLAGMGAVLAASVTLYTIVKWAGAAYLVWLGVKMWRGAGGAGAGRALARRAPSRARMFRQAFLVTLLNPKGLVFFVAFAPQFIDPARGYAQQAAILVATFTVLGTVNAILWGLAAGEMRARVARPGVTAWMARIGGGGLIGAGALTALSHRA